MSEDAAPEPGMRIRLSPGVARRFYDMQQRMEALERSRSELGDVVRDQAGAPRGDYTMHVEGGVAYLVLVRPYATESADAEVPGKALSDGAGTWERASGTAERVDAPPAADGAP